MILKEILFRRAVREYKPDPVSEESIAEIIKAGQFAPSAHGSRAVHYSDKDFSDDKIHQEKW